MKVSWDVRYIVDYGIVAGEREQYTRVKSVHSDLNVMSSDVQVNKGKS